MRRNKYTVDLSERAEEMLLRHSEFLARVSVPAARKFIAAFRTAAGGLKENPERFPFLALDGIPPKLYRKCLFLDRYELIFLICESNVSIDAIRDCRQDPENIFS